METGNHLVKADEDVEPQDPRLYQSLIGSLMYLATCTMPDIAFAVGVLARFSSKPDSGYCDISEVPPTLELCFKVAA